MFISSHSRELAREFFKKDFQCSVPECWQFCAQKESLKWSSTFPWGKVCSEQVKTVRVPRAVTGLCEPHSHCILQFCRPDFQAEQIRNYLSWIFTVGLWVCIVSGGNSVLGACLNVCLKSAAKGLVCSLLGTWTSEQPCRNTEMKGWRNRKQAGERRTE